jgi:hypothetical protein
MYSAIVVATFPGDHHSARQQWQGFLATAAVPQEDPTVDQLAENIWQIDFLRSPGVIARRIYACEQYGIAYRILPFDIEPPCILGGSSPSPK